VDTLYERPVSCQHAGSTCGWGGMGGLLCSLSAGGDTASCALGLHGCGLGLDSCSVSLPKRSAQRLWIVAISSGGASWTPLVASARWRVASNMRLVAVMARTGIA
jgi:hypothetical protein